MSKFEAKHDKLIFVVGYVATICVSLAVSDIPILPQFVPILWCLFAIFRLWQCGVSGGVPLRQHIASAFILQFPGMVCVAGSLWSVFKDSAFQWANGLLELWCYPFLSLFELIPDRSVFHLSAVYLSSCILPFLLFGLFSVIPWLSDRRVRRYVT